MNLKTMAALYIAFALPVQAQTTAAEQLQRGIFAQETAGKTDEAISIYGQLVDSPLTPREIAAQAQFRLVQALLQKGEITLATREMERLEREFLEYRALISSLASQKNRSLSVAAGSSGAGPLEIETAGPVSISGAIKQVLWQNPVTLLKVSALGADYTIRLQAPNVIARHGLTRNSFKLGDSLTIQGLVARDDPSTIQANILTSADGKVLFDRSQPADVPPAGVKEE